MTVGEQFESIQKRMNEVARQLGLEEREVISFSEATLPMLEDKIVTAYSNTPLPEPNCTILKHSHRLKDCPDRR